MTPAGGPATLSARLRSVMAVASSFVDAQTLAELSGQRRHRQLETDRFALDRVRVRSRSIIGSGTGGILFDAGRHVWFCRMVV
jgi:hypothetical protein